MSEHHTNSLTMLFLILCAFISLTLASPANKIYSLEESQELFETFINEYNKQYEGKEKEERFQIFLDNLKEVNSLNEKSSNAVYGITKFSDLTKEEFIKTYTGVKVDMNLINKKNRNQIPLTFNYTAPDEFDWRSRGVVSRVKNQGRCGSCWAFSASGNVESINAIKTGNLVEVSEQQLVDCDKDSNGCQNGYPDHAISYLVQNGAMSEESYPYEDGDGSCRFNSNGVVIHLTSSEKLQIQEAQMKEMLYSTGPLSIVIDSSGLQGYNGGIITDRCPSNDLNHAVLLVGYGQENGVDYWLVKNSWGTNNGEEGYFRMQRGVNCLNIEGYGVSTAIM